MRQASDKMLTHLIEAMDQQRAVTIRYIRPDGMVSRRTIEIFGFFISTRNNLLISCWDRRSQSIHTFNIARVTDYTIHHPNSAIAAYTVPVVVDSTTVLDADTDEVVSVTAWDRPDEPDLAA
jgi:predicted DNA-binding transcriptional regulator YafY